MKDNKGDFGGEAPKESTRNQTGVISGGKTGRVGVTPVETETIKGKPEEKKDGDA